MSIGFCVFARIPDFSKCRSFMSRNVIRFIAFDLILWFFLCGMMCITFIVEVFCMHFDDRTGNPSCFRIPAYFIACFKLRCHNQILIVTIKQLPCKKDLVN